LGGLPTGTYIVSVGTLEFGTMMAGTPVIAAFVAQIAFWVLLVIGVFTHVIGTRGAAVFLVLWAIGYAALPRLGAVSEQLVTPWLAMLDIALVFIVFQGDLRLT
jgi:hypothetical protein